MDGSYCYWYNLSTLAFWEGWNGERVQTCYEKTAWQQWQEGFWRTVSVIQFKVKTPKVTCPHLDTHTWCKCLNLHHNLQINDLQHITVLREQFSWPATKNLILRLDPTQWDQEKAGFVDSDKKLVSAYTIPPGTRTSHHCKYSGNLHPWENTKSCDRKQKKDTQGSEKLAIFPEIRWAETVLHGHVWHGAQGPKGSYWGKRTCTTLKARPYLK